MSPSEIESLYSAAEGMQHDATDIIHALEFFNDLNLEPSVAGKTLPFVGKLLVSSRAHHALAVVLVRSATCKTYRGFTQTDFEQLLFRSGNQLSYFADLICRLEKGDHDPSLTFDQKLAAAASFALRSAAEAISIVDCVRAITADDETPKPAEVSPQEGGAE